MTDGIGGTDGYKMTEDDSVIMNYRFMRDAHRKGDEEARLYWYKQNRHLHACDIFWEVELPEHVRVIHPLGSILGRATYGDYFVSYQNVTVGSSVDHVYPVLGKGVVLFGGARVIGATLGNNVWVQADTTVMDCTIPDNSVVFPAMNKYRCAFKPTKRNVIEHFFSGRQ